MEKPANEQTNSQTNLTRKKMWQGKINRKIERNNEQYEATEERKCKKDS